MASASETASPVWMVRFFGWVNAVVELMNAVGVAEVFGRFVEAALLRPLG